MYALSDKASEVPRPSGSHMHTAWAFTKPGIYITDVTARAKQSGNGYRGARTFSVAAHNDGGEAIAEMQRLTFLVEKKFTIKQPADAPADPAPPCLRSLGTILAVSLFAR